MKVMPIFGTRPEAIKLAPVIKALQARPDQFDVVVTVTAQHRQMLDQVLQRFDITPEHDLDVMQAQQDIFQLTSRILNGLAPVLDAERPDLVLVQGDTTTVMASALAAFYSKIPVAHVEAGLRTYDKLQPFPEEMNRRLVSHLADWHFAPTQAARDALLREGIEAERIFVTGNTVIDALLQTVNRDYVFTHPLLKQIDFERNRVILATSHRRENWGEPIRQICRAIRRVVETHRDVQVIYAVHLNPAVQNAVREELGGLDRVHLLEPLGYNDFVQLMSRSYLILTDSGGVQEEAPSLGVPVLVLRDVTERPEGVAAGTLKLVGTDTEVIAREAERLLTDAGEYQRMANTANPYGDGLASERIADVLWQVQQAKNVTTPSSAGAVASNGTQSAVEVKKQPA